MKDCEDCKPETCGTDVPVSELGISLKEIADLFDGEEKAFDFASDQDVYEELKKRDNDFFVSDEHVRDSGSGYTYYVVALNKEAHDEFTKNIERQHIFQDVYEESNDEHRLL